MKTNKMNWTSHNKLNAEPIKARINRLRRHNFLLEMFIAGCVGASIALTFVIVHMMVVGSAWTW
jgi:hypothetical protein